VSEYPPIPGYDLLKLLGRNGHLIYLARQSSSGCLVRLNVVNSSGEFGQMVADELRQQAQVLATLDHPNIVRLVEFGDARGFGFFSAVEYIEGASPAEKVFRLELPDHTELVRIVRLVAAALDYAHGRDVIHGSVHPKNILLDRTGHVSLIGFAEVGPRRPGGMCFGNPHFLAPEQLTDFDKAVPQTDVYALAEVVFLLLSGSFPFHGAVGIADLFDRKLSGAVPSIRGCRPELPRRVELNLERAMAVRPEDRFRSAGEFVEELDGALQLSHEEDKKWWQFWR
jgi:serine/threonine protein kinase